MGLRRTNFKPGDWVVFTKTKRSVSPGPRAKEVRPEAHGDGYSYCVDKYWIVRQVQDGDKLVVETRRGKRHVVAASDPNVRRPNLLERWLLAYRFPSKDRDKSASNTTAA